MQGAKDDDRHLHSQDRTHRRCLQLAPSRPSRSRWLAWPNVVPTRFTPGFDKRLPDRSLGLIYAALALGLAASELAQPDRAREDAAAAPLSLPRRLDRLEEFRQTMGVREMR